MSVDWRLGVIFCCVLKLQYNCTYEKIGYTYENWIVRKVRKLYNLVEKCLFSKITSK